MGKLLIIKLDIKKSEGPVLAQLIETGILCALRDKGVQVHIIADPAHLRNMDYFIDALHWGLEDLKQEGVLEGQLNQSSINQGWPCGSQWYWHTNSDSEIHNCFKHYLAKGLRPQYNHCIFGSKDGAKSTLPDMARRSFAFGGTE